MKQLIDLTRKKFVAGADRMQAGCCLWTEAAERAATELGLPCLPQAGSASFRFKAEDDDDGVSPNAFSYVWEGFGSVAVVQRLLMGELPEMHSWLAFFPPGEEPWVLDMTWGYQAQQCKELAGFEWTGPALPEVYCGPASEVGVHGVSLRPDRGCCLFLAQRILPEVRREHSINFENPAFG